MVTLDIQYLPDMEQTCPVCMGQRYRPERSAMSNGAAYSIVDILALDVAQALTVFKDEPKILRELELLCEVGLDYLHLGESTPSLSGEKPNV